MFHYTKLYFMYIVTSFLCFTTKLSFMYIVTSFFYFTTQSCTSCTLSPRFIFHYTQLTVVTSFLCFTTHSCTACTMSPLFYASLHTAVLHVHCHLIFMFHYTQLYLMYIVTSFMFHYRAVLYVHCHIFYVSLQSCTSCSL